MESDNNICQYLDWDSNFFGVRIGRVKLTRINSSSIEFINNWSCANQIDCLYFLADADDGDTIWLAEDYGFHLVDVRVTFRQKLVGNRNRVRECVGNVFRSSIPSDIPILRSIARVSFRITRFYYDRNFPNELCDSLYETWIEKSCTEFGETVMVAENQGSPIGFISLKLVGPDQGEIGLVGVKPDWQGRGLGQELINEALCWFSDNNVSLVKVVTQGRNSQAQRLYQRSGFLTDTIQIWYHKWFKLDENSN